MNDVDRVEQWRQVSEHYRSLTDDELIGIARQKDDLTDIAQQALAAEVQSRKLEIPAEAPAEDEEDVGRRLPPAAGDLEDEGESPYEEDRELVEIERVFSLRDAQQLEALLKEDGIPFYMGDEKVTRAEDVKSDFSKGVPVLMMRVGLAFATRARRDFKPLDDPEWRDDENPQEWKPVDIFCPRCRSAKVVMEGGEPDTKMRGYAAQFSWRCETCGKRWQDDGVLDAG